MQCFFKKPNKIKPIDILLLFRFLLKDVISTPFYADVIFLLFFISCIMVQLDVVAVCGGDF